MPDGPTISPTRQTTSPARHATGSATDAGDEFNDEFIVDGKRARSQIEHEDNLIDHRMTWLILSNTFLFAGFFLVVANRKPGLDATTLLYIDGSL